MACCCQVEFTLGWRKKKAARKRARAPPSTPTPTTPTRCLPSSITPRRMHPFFGHSPDTDDAFPEVQAGASPRGRQQEVPIDRCCDIVKKSNRALHLYFPRSWVRQRECQLSRRRHACYRCRCCCRARAAQHRQHHQQQRHRSRHPHSLSFLRGSSHHIFVCETHACHLCVIINQI